MQATDENLGIRPDRLKYLMHGKCTNEEESLSIKEDRVKNGIQGRKQANLVSVLKMIS